MINRSPMFAYSSISAICSALEEYWQHTFPTQVRKLYGNPQPIYAVEPLADLLEIFFGINLAQSLRFKMHTTVESNDGEIWANPVHDEKYTCYVEVLLRYKLRYLHIAKTCGDKGMQLELKLAENFGIESIKVVRYIERKEVTGREYDPIEEIVLSSTGVILQAQSCNGKVHTFPLEGMICFKELARTLVFSALEILPDIKNFIRKDTDVTKTRPMKLEELVVRR